jgi:cytochrome P450
MQDVIRHVADIYSHRNDPDSKYHSQVTVFHEILQSDLPEREKVTDRLWQDGQVTVIAGTLTTAAALAEITFHLLDQPMELQKLKTELDRIISDPDHLPETAKLEQLPYLTGVIKEGLRLSSGISTRLQRIATEDTLVFTAKSPKGDRDGANGTEKTYILRPGIPLSMTGLLIHHSPTYFEDPMGFRPQRWVDDKSLNKYLVPFSRGTRACVGISLAYTELYLTIAAIFCQYGSRDVHSPNDKGWLELYKTTRRDLDIVGDGVTPLYRDGTNGVVIKVHPMDR